VNIVANKNPITAHNININQVKFNNILNGLEVFKMKNTEITIPTKVNTIVTAK